MGPFVPDLISDQLNLVVALVLGIGFGVALEQAGFSSSRRLAGVFPGRDSIADPLIEFSDYGMKAASVRALFAELRTRLVPLVREIPVPFPYPFLQGLDWCKFADEKGYTFGNTYLFGQLHRVQR